MSAVVAGYRSGMKLLLTSLWRSLALVARGPATPQATRPVRTPLRPGPH